MTTCDNVQSHFGTRGDHAASGDCQCHGIQAKRVSQDRLSIRVVHLLINSLGNQKWLLRCTYMDWIKLNMIRLSNLDGPTGSVSELSQAQFQWMFVLRLLAQSLESTPQLLIFWCCLRSARLPRSSFQLVQLQHGSRSSKTRSAVIVHAWVMSLNLF